MSIANPYPCQVEDIHILTGSGAEKTKAVIRNFPTTEAFEESLGDWGAKARAGLLKHLQVREFAKARADRLDEAEIDFATWEPESRGDLSSDPRVAVMAKALGKSIEDTVALLASGVLALPKKAKK